jgi:hypothetical protein
MEDCEQAAEKLHPLVSIWNPVTIKDSRKVGFQKKRRIWNFTSLLNVICDVVQTKEDELLIV